MKNPDILDLQDNIALLEARTGGLLRKYGEADSSGAHDAILKSAKVIKRGIKQNDIAECQRGLDMLMEAIEPVRVQSAVWHEIAKVQERVGRTVATANKWYDDHDQFVPIGEVITTLTSLMNVVLKYIDDPEKRAILAEELRSYFPPE